MSTKAIVCSDKQNIKVFQMNLLYNCTAAAAAARFQRLAVLALQPHAVHLLTTLAVDDETAIGHVLLDLVASIDHELLELVYFFFQLK